MKEISKRKYENKLIKRAVKNEANRRFLLGRLKREWEEVEKTIQKDRKRWKLYETIKDTGEVLGLTMLGMAAVCGVLIVGAVAPNIFSAFDRMGRHRRYFNKKSFRKQMYYYNHKGYIKIARSGEDDAEVRITDLGSERVLRQTLKDLKILPQEKWDGIWRVIIFDIPERNKWAREGLRESLKRMGLFPLQKSTFVTPHPCGDEIAFLGSVYDTGDKMRIVEARRINFDRDLKDFFGLGS